MKPIMQLDNALSETGDTGSISKCRRALARKLTPRHRPWAFARSTGYLLWSSKFPKFLNFMNFEPNKNEVQEVK